MEKRDKKIKKLRKEDKCKWTYKKLGEKFLLSEERIRQIIVNDEKVQFVNREDIIKQLKEKYKKRFHDKLSQKHLLEDIENSSKMSRKKEDVIKRDALIRYLYEELEIPFFKIAVLLHRDHTTIIHSYNKNDE